KRIWTPSWALYSAGWTFWMLAGFYAVMDLAGWRRWAFPFAVVGVNSIAMYLMAQRVLLKGWLEARLRIHLGREWFEAPPYGPVLLSASSVLVLVLVFPWV